MITSRAVFAIGPAPTESVVEPFEPGEFSLPDPAAVTHARLELERHRRRLLEISPQRMWSAREASEL